MFFTYMNNSCARFNQTVLNLACCSGSVVQTSLLWTSLAVRWIYMPPSGNSPSFFCKEEDTANLHLQRLSGIYFYVKTRQKKKLLEIIYSQILSLSNNFQAF